MISNIGLQNKLQYSQLNIDSESLFAFLKKLIGSFLATFYLRGLLSFDYNLYVVDIVFIVSVPHHRLAQPPHQPGTGPSRFLQEMKSVIVFQKSLKYSWDYKHVSVLQPTLSSLCSPLLSSQLTVEKLTSF